MRVIRVLVFLTIMTLLNSFGFQSLEAKIWHVDDDHGYRPRVCVKSLAIKLLRAYPPNN